MKKLHAAAIALLLAALTLIAPFSSVSAEGLPFVDVPETAWFYDPVCWAYENELVSGMTPTTFGPKQFCTRAQLVQILWVLDGKPEASIENPFTDVKEGKWYYSAVLWAVDRGVTNGTTSTTFSPDKKCTRAQALTFIWTYFGKEEVDPEARFSDVPSDKYFYGAVNWAYHNGVTSGMGNNKFEPNTVVNRAMVVTFLFRMKHVLDGGQHEFNYLEDVAPTCTEGSGKLYACECGNSKIIYDEDGEQPLGHDFRKAKLISDATATKPTVYQLVCVRCGKQDGKGNRQLGKPIFREPNIQSDPDKIPTHVWTNEELKNGIHIVSSDGAEATITRKWFANAWCYITHIVLPEGSYSHFTGTNVYAQFGRRDEQDFMPGYAMMARIPEAKILFTGDTQLLNNRATLRGSVPYQTNIHSSFSCWSSLNGSYGQIKQYCGYSGYVDFSDLLDLGITDVLCFGIPYIEDGCMSMEIFDSEPDFDASSYPEKNLRRETSAIGFKNVDGTVHIYHVASDGCAYTNTGASDPSKYANDRASYGNSKRELMILMSTLGVDYESNLDGGWSVCLNIRINGRIEQLNAADFSKATGYSPWPARNLWDYLYFK